jgi:hypothetical protein
LNNGKVSLSSSSRTIRCIFGSTRWIFSTTPFCCGVFAAVFSSVIHYLCRTLMSGDCAHWVTSQVFDLHLNLYLRSPNLFYLSRLSVYHSMHPNLDVNVPIYSSHRGLKGSCGIENPALCPRFPLCTRCFMATFRFAVQCLACLKFLLLAYSDYVFKDPSCFVAPMCRIIHCISVTLYC